VRRIHVTETPSAAAENAATKPAKKSGGLSSMLLADLKSMAAGLGIAGAGSMKKAQLVDAIRASQSGGSTNDRAAQPAAAPAPEQVSASADVPKAADEPAPQTTVRTRTRKQRQAEQQAERAEQQAEHTPEQKSDQKSEQASEQASGKQDQKKSDKQQGQKQDQKQDQGQRQGKQHQQGQQNQQGKQDRDQGQQGGQQGGQQCRDQHGTCPEAGRGSDICVHGSRQPAAHRVRKSLMMGVLREHPNRRGAVVVSVTWTTVSRSASSSPRGGPRSPRRQPVFRRWVSVVSPGCGAARWPRWPG
jgi:Rho termination factor-like protein